MLKEKLLVQKNKIDVVKAVYNSAAKKLAVLSLAVAVSGGYITSAQMSENEANRQLQMLKVPERMNSPLAKLRKLFKIANTSDQRKT